MLHQVSPGLFPHNKQLLARDPISRKQIHRNLPVSFEGFDANGGGWRTLTRLNYTYCRGLSEFQYAKTRTRLLQYSKGEQQSIIQHSPQHTHTLYICMYSSDVIGLLSVLLHQTKINPVQSKTNVHKRMHYESCVVCEEVQCENLAICGEKPAMACSGMAHKRLLRGKNTHTQKRKS